MDPRAVLEQAIGPYPSHCGGYANPPASGAGYVAVMKLSVEEAPGDLDEGLDGIVAYDRAEAADAYVGQINMLTASSFCGPAGVVWGYDVARAEGLEAARAAPRHRLERHDGVEVPVLSLDPLLDAGRRLFGTARHRRFNPLPGAMVVCANKARTVRPRERTTLWAALALAVPEDRERDARLFIEDCSDTESEPGAPLADLERRMALSILRCGRDHAIAYREILVGLRRREVGPGRIGCALACVAYVTLPPAAIPPGSRPSALADMTIGGWEEALGLPALPGPGA